MGIKNQNKKFDKDIAIATCPPWSVDSPPSNLACISEYLNSKEFKVDVFDINIDVYNKSEKDVKKLWHIENQKGWTFKKEFKEKTKPIFEINLNFWAKKIAELKVPIVAFGVIQDNILFTFELVKKIKALDPSKIVIVGGISCYNKHEREVFYPKGYEDLVFGFVIGEAEETLVEFINLVKKGELKKASEVKGMIILKSGKESKLIPRDFLDLSTAPFPKFKDFNFSDYNNGNNIWPHVFMGKGCSSNCVYCVDRIVMGKNRAKKPDDFVEELKFHRYQMGFKTFAFDDLAINCNIDSLNKVCDLIIEACLKITWVASIIANRKLSKDLLLKMKKAGCKSLILGIESGSDRVLKLMRKPFTIKDVENVLKLMTDAGIESQVNFMIGFPGETEEDFQETLDFLDRNQKFITKTGGLNPFGVLNYSELMEKKEEYGIIIDKDCPNPEVYWYTKDGNDFKLRNDRLRRLIAHVKTLDIISNNANCDYLPKKVLMINSPPSDPRDVEGLGKTSEFLCKMAIAQDFLDLDNEFVLRGLRLSDDEIIDKEMHLMFDSVDLSDYNVVVFSVVPDNLDLVKKIMGYVKEKNDSATFVVWSHLDEDIKADYVIKRDLKEKLLDIIIKVNREKDTLKSKFF